MGFLKKIKGMAGGVDSDLMAHGLLGRGLVTDAQLTGTAVTIGVEEHRVCNLTVQVFLDGQQPYLATCRQRIPVWMLGQLGGGAAVAVRANPANLDEIAVDLGTEAPVVTIAAPAGGGAAAVLATGVPATAVIVQSVPLGVRSHEGHDVHLLNLTVSVDGQQPYAAQVGNAVPAAALPLLFPGAKVPVKVLPGAAGSVVVDWDAALV